MSLVGHHDGVVHVQVPSEQARCGGEPLVPLAQQDQGRGGYLGQPVYDRRVDVHGQLLDAGRHVHPGGAVTHRGVPLLARLSLAKPRSGGDEHQPGDVGGMVDGVGQRQVSAEAVPDEDGWPLRVGDHRTQVGEGVAA